MKIKQFYGLCNDVMFRYVFGMPKHKTILIALLNAVLDFKKNKKIKDITILNPLNLKEKIDAKLSIVDIKATDEIGRQYNIEMQVNSDADYKQRILFYLAKLFVEQLKESEKYNELKKTISISFLDYTLLPEEKDFHNIYRFKNIKSNKEFTDIKEIHIIELGKYKLDKNKKFKNALEKWLYIFKKGIEYINKTEQMPGELKKEEGIVMAVKAMEEALADRIVRETMISRQRAIWDAQARLQNALKEGFEKGEKIGIQKGEKIGIRKGEKIGIRKGEKIGIRKGEKIGIQKGEKIGIQKGEKIGIQKGLIKITFNMLKKGYNIKEIKDVTGLSESQIKKLKNRINKKKKIKTL
ncbi:MAG TPA: Rpn family recombination-promoting nuclease/putative transposase [bacterium]|nr:Rpn family recombination-promoting nuclease/putative transposase [bacterium]